MNKLLFILTIILIYFSACNQNVENKEQKKDSLNNIVPSRIYSKQELDYFCEEGKKSGKIFLERGNLIAYYFDAKIDYIAHYEEIFLERYNIICYVGYHITNKCEKEMMDSAIFELYGNNIYKIVKLIEEREYKGIPYYQFKDGSFAEGFIDTRPKVLLGFEKFDKYLIQDLTKQDTINYTDPYDYIYLQFIIDTLGNLKNPKVIVKLDSIIDNKILKRLQNCKFKWEPGYERGKKVQCRMMYYLDFRYKKCYQDTLSL